MTRRLDDGETRTAVRPSPRSAAQAIRARAGGSSYLRLLLGAPFVAIVTTIIALIATAEANVSFRDPDHVAVLYIFEVGAGVMLMIAGDIFLRARRRNDRRRPSLAQMKEVRRERWTAKRGIGVAVAVVSFYLTYLAYRNLKAVVPLLRPDDLFDGQLADLDRVLFLGNDPAVLLHDLLGTGFQTHVISTIYVAFIVFLPLSLAVALVFSDRLEVGLFYAAALSINWILGAASYFLLPALGPIYFDPATFAGLPHSEVTRLQELLLEQRVGFLDDPATGTPQAIAAFASLHIAMSFTALLAAYVLEAGRALKRALWIWMGVTILATVYLGWHYFVDDIAGFAIGGAALVLAKVLTGFDPRPSQSRGSKATPQSPSPQPADPL